MNREWLMWTEAEEDIIREHSTLTIPELQKLLSHRSLEAIRLRRYRLGLSHLTRTPYLSIRQAKVYIVLPQDIVRKLKFRASKERTGVATICRQILMESFK